MNAKRTHIFFHPFLLCVLLLGVFSVCDAQAQLYGDLLKFELITPEDGLSGQHIGGIVQDRLGFLWFGTENGLDKYDGYTFTRYRFDPEDASSLSHSLITALYTDRNGTLWVGTSSGLNQYHHKTDSFTRYRPPNTDSEFFTIYDITEDHAGNVWLATSGYGVNRFDPKTGTFEMWRHDEHDPRSLSDDVVWTVYEDRQRNLWIGTHNGLNRFDPETKTFIRYQHNPANPHSLSHNTVRAIHADRQGNLWIGTDGGLNRFDPEDETFERFQHDNGDPHSISHDAIIGIHEDRRGVLWVGTNGGGLNIFDRETAAFHRYRPDPGNPDSSKLITLRTLYKDRHGSLWIGLQAHGVVQLARHARKFRHYTHIPDDPHSLSYPAVNAVYEDHQGILWVSGGGPLYALPFETLLTKPAGTMQDARYLIEAIPINYLSSASLLKTLRESQSRKVSTTQYLLIAFAHPAYTNEPFQEDGNMRNLRDRAYRNFLGGLVAELPETADEAKVIADVLNAPQESEALQLRENASRKKVFELQASERLDDYDYLLFAMHGVLPGEIDHVTQSALILSDGFLTMADVFGLQLNARLVSLSACNTGMGIQVKGEGVMGLTRAFMYAGAPAVAVTLWSVESLSAKEPDIGFFRHLNEGMAPA